MKKILLFLALSCLPLNAVTTEQQAKHYFKKGIIEFLADDYKKAVHYFALAALKGSSDGVYFYAYCAEYGLGCTKNMARALLYYTMAKRMGNAKAIDRMKNEPDVIY